jgi:hypothetical protein
MPNAGSRKHAEQGSMRVITFGPEMLSIIVAR